MVSLRHVSLGGTKVLASAYNPRAMSYELMFPLQGESVAHTSEQLGIPVMIFIRGGSAGVSYRFWVLELDVGAPQHQEEDGFVKASTDH